jgi:acyl transferase domain-containing protein
MTKPARTPIAIVGASALFPGSLDATGFWSNILHGNDLITDVPASHWLIEDYYDPDPSKPDKTYARRGAFLPHIDFDAMRWGVPPSIVPETDTSQLLALIVAQRVLEDASKGAPETLDRSRTSVILGVTSGQELLGSMVSRLQRPVWVRALREAGIPESEVTTICDRISASYTDWKESTFPGLLGNVVAGRIANRLDLGGTNCVSDAACASSMSALSMGINELLLGDSDLVISGGVDTMNDIFMFMCFSKTPALSASGDCRPFSDNADGTMLGEGLGMVALKRLEDAQRDGDRIYGVIHGCGSSSDGRSKSVYAPVSSGQANALRRAYGQAGYGPETVELIEAHGTGTRAGDKAEFGGLEMVFDETGREDRQWCQLGSVKSQIGHTKSAAGAAGLLKALMAVHHRVLPPTIKVDKPNPGLDLPKSAFHITTRARPWVRNPEHPRRASVSAFGFGGSNFHVALEEAPGSETGRGAPRLPAQGRELVVLAADNASALVEQAKAMAERCSKPGALAWEARGAERTRTGTHRLAIVAADEASLAAQLQDAITRIELSGTEPFSTPAGTRYGHGPVDGDVAFVFPGQGSQYVDMGAQLAMQFDAALGVWDQAAATGMRLHDAVFPITDFEPGADARAAARLAATDVAQPAIGCTSLSLLTLLRSVGLEAACVAGHSFGEVTALHAAGVIDTEAFLRVAQTRGATMAEAASTPGAMTAVSATVEVVREALVGLNTDVVVANHNAPEQVVLSGKTPAIEAVETALGQQGLRCKRLPVATAFHSEVVAGASQTFGAAIAEVDMAAATIPVFANASAQHYPSEPAAIRDQLAAQLAQPVRFVEMIEAMYAEGVRTFVEVGPGSVLTGLIGRILGDRPHRALHLDRKGRDGVRTLLEGLATLVADGHPLQLGALWEGYAAPLDPAATPDPKVSLSLNGANYGKPYPPARASDNPPPNPERVETPVPQPAVAVAPTPEPKPVPRSPEPTVMSQSDSAPPVVVPSASIPSVQVEPAPSAPISEGWGALWEETQRQTAQAHAAYLDAMAQSHNAYLQTVERSMAMLRGAPVVESTTSMPVVAQAVVAQPAVAAPVVAPPVVAAPQPVPVAPAPSRPPVAEAPAPVAAEPVAPAAPALDLQAVMTAVVSEKTGYPPEMLSAEMNLEADLGIDSIKRVEILSAVQEAAPGMPEVDPNALAKLQTLGEIVEHMQSLLGTPAPASAPAAPTAPSVDLHAVMTAVVAEKTGYPPEMLSAEMNLEADLGIDSIKRVEILSAVQDAAPDMPEVDPNALAKLQTLGEIVEHMQSLMGPVAAPVAAAPAAPSVDLHAVMTAVVADKTGYPPEMLTADMNLEADLGIDSIKRVEILSAVQDAAPDMPEVDPNALAKLQTLGEIVEHMQSLMGGSPATGAAAPVAATAAAPASELGRFVLRAVPEPAPGLTLRGFASAGLIAVTDDGAGVAAALVDTLTRRGASATLWQDGAALPAGARGLILLDGLQSVDAASSVEFHARAFERAKALGSATQPSLLVTVQDTGGAFGTSGLEPSRAWVSGLPGLARTANQEWAQASVKALDVQRGSRAPVEMATAIVEELLQGGNDLDVGLAADGTRVVLQSVPEAVQPEVLPLQDGAVIVASGGARGVTAATLIALAARGAYRFALLGRTPLAEESALTRAASDDASLKRALLQEASARGESVAPAELGKRAKALLAAREVRATLDAIAAAGSTAEYVPVSVTDAPALTAALDGVRAKWGRIDAVVHAAGVLADRKIEDKTRDQFDLVFSTKVAGLHALLTATAGDELKLLIMFSSVAARYGNTGQVDYAMANEVLNKVAWSYAAAHPQCRVKSLGWGPWKGGMVTPQLEQHFAAMGVALIPLETGAQMMLDEIQHTAADTVELVLGGAPAAGAFAPAEESDGVRVDVVVDRESHPFLVDHSIAGTPVVPVAFAVEWFSRAARAACPGLKLAGLHDVSVLRGISLKDFDSKSTTLHVHTVREAVNGTTQLGLELRDDAGNRYYRARATMAAKLPDAPSAPSTDLGLQTWGDRTVYDGSVLFHGPDFQVIRSIDGVSDKGIAADVAGVREAGWQSPWCTDPLAVDGGLQLALLWSQHMLGGSSLPTAIGEVKTYATPAEGPLRCTLTGRRAEGQKAVADVVFHDQAGTVVAELYGVETHQLPRA